MLKAVFESSNGVILDFAGFPGISNKGDVFALLKIVKLPERLGDIERNSVDSYISEILINHEETHFFESLLDELLEMEDDELLEITFDNVIEKVIKATTEEEIVEALNERNQFVPIGDNLCLLTNVVTYNGFGPYLSFLLFGPDIKFNDQDFCELIVAKQDLIELFEFFSVVHNQLSRREALFNSMMEREEMRLEKTGDKIHKGFDELDKLLHEGIITMD